MNNKKITVYVHWVLLTLFVTLIFIGCTKESSNQSSENQLRAMTFNIRYGLADDGTDSWQFRNQYVFETIREFNPDFVGLQEALDMQVDELRENFPNYDFIGVGRDDGKKKGEFAAIMYYRDRFIIDSSSTFWFSDTPQSPGSKTWGNNHTRICTWALMHDKFSRKSFYLFNLHLDHESQNSREKSTQLLIAEIQKRGNQVPVIIMGDFNCGEDNKAIETITMSGFADSFRKNNVRTNNDGTFNGFKGDKSGDKIDYIFINNLFNSIASQIVYRNFNGKYPSDHFPVTAILSF